MDYKKIYSNLISKAQTRVLDKEIYREKHHVVPRCLGGKDIKDNIVELLPEEHYIAHQLLHKIYPENEKLLYSLRMMCIHNSNGRMNNKEYAWIKNKISKNLSNHFKRVWNDLSEEERENRIQNMKWKHDIERREIHKTYMLEKYANNQYREIFTEKMTDVNKNIKKRKAAGEKIKELWKDECYREKMKNRRRGSNSSTLKEKWKDPEFKKKMSESRKKRYETQ